MSACQRKYFYSAALLFNLITFLMNSESAYIYFFLVLINSLVFFEVIFLVGAKTGKFLKIELML